MVLEMLSPCLSYLYIHPFVSIAVLMVVILSLHAVFVGGIRGVGPPWTGQRVRSEWVRGDGSKGYVCPICQISQCTVAAMYPICLFLSLSFHHATVGCCFRRVVVVLHPSLILPAMLRARKVAAAHGHGSSSAVN